MAQRGINKVILIGNLGQDPTVRYMPNGGAVTNVSMATSETWKDSNSGQPMERTEWHRVVLFGRLGEIAGEYLKKGATVYIEGRLQTRKWQDQTGQDRYTTEVVTSVMQMLGPKPDNATNAQQNDQTQTPPPSQTQQPPPINDNTPSAIAGMPGDDFDDDIPF